MLKRIRQAVRKRYEIRKEGLVDVLDEHGNPTGEAVNIYELHERSLWHRTANVHVIDGKGNVLLQKRSAKIRTFPNMWQMAAGGHIRHGDTSLETAVQEMEEEIAVSVRPEDLVFIGTSTKDEPQLDGTMRDREFQDNYLLVREVDAESAKLQAHEVGGLAWMPISEFRKLVGEKHPDYVQHAGIPVFLAYVDAHPHGTDKD